MLSWCVRERPVVCVRNFPRNLVELCTARDVRLPQVGTVYIIRDVHIGYSTGEVFLYLHEIVNPHVIVLSHDRVCEPSFHHTLFRPVRLHDADARLRDLLGPLQRMRELA